MATADTLLDRNSAVAAREHAESPADLALSAAAMVGAAVGAIGGAVLGAESAFPVIYGGLGAMLGSGFAAGGWFLCSGLCCRR
jgi:hypothetical protein